MFASRVTKIVTTVSEPPYAVTIRRLSWRQIQQAQRAVFRQGLELLNETAGGDVIAKAFKQLQELGGEAAIREQTATAEKDPGRNYDRATVLKAGILTWTEVGSTDTPPDKRPAAEIEALVDDLEEDVAEQLFREILRMSHVLPAAEGESATKNG